MTLPGHVAHKGKMRNIQHFGQNIWMEETIWKT